MLHPSYSELIQAINNNAEEDDNTMMLNSRYSLVLATSKRARQLIAGAEPLVPNAADKKPLSVAIDELYKGEVKIVAAESDEETTAPATEEASERLLCAAIPANNIHHAYRGLEMRQPVLRLSAILCFPPEAVMSEMRILVQVYRPLQAS